MEAAPMGGMVDGVKKERLHEECRLLTRGGRGGGRPIWPRWAGVKILWLPLFTSLLPASVKSLWKESYGGEKKLFPGESGKNPSRGGKKPLPKKMDNRCGHCSTFLGMFFRSRQI